MRLLFLCAAVWAVTEVSSSGVTIGITPYSHPVLTQYHSQDAYGQYTYGYSTPTSAKSETKLANGVTHGGYSYIDANGILQTVQYVADPVHGFQVAATNLPQDVPDVAYARAQHFAHVAAIRAEHAALAAARVQYSNPVAIPASAVQQVPLVALPAPVQDLPEVIRARAEHLAAFEAIKVRDLALAQQVAISPVPAQLSGPVVPIHAAHVDPAGPNFGYAHHSLHYVPALPVHQIATSSQYQAQDRLGQYSYGYVGPLSSKSESKTADGVVRGGYSYIDANGVLQTVSYIADDVHGFRVAATNIPVGPAEVANAHFAGVAPVAVAVSAPVDVAVRVEPLAIAAHVPTVQAAAVATPVVTATAAPRFAVPAVSAVAVDPTFAAPVPIAAPPTVGPAVAGALQAAADAHAGAAQSNVWYTQETYY